MQFGGGIQEKDSVKGEKMKIEGHLNIIEQEVKSLRVRLKDSVEVVRCKDCKHRDDDGMCRGRGWPMQLVPDDGFCDKGERRE